MEHFRSNLLSFDTFSKLEITPLQSFNNDPHFFLTKIKTIPISFINFSKFHEFIFLRIEIIAKSSFSPIIFHTKKAILDKYFEIPPFHYNHVEVWVFSHKHTRRSMNIIYAKILKFTESFYQTATSSGLLK